MTPRDKHKDALSFLLGHALPSDDEIDRMSSTELDEFLNVSGVDVKKLNQTVSDLAGKFPGKLALAKARHARLANTAPRQEFLVPGTKDEIVAALVRKFGRLEDIPLAARGAKELSDEEWTSLYVDLMKRDKLS